MCVFDPICPETLFMHRFNMYLLGLYYMLTESANFYKMTNGKYFRLCGPYRFSIPQFSSFTPPPLSAFSPPTSFIIFALQPFRNKIFLSHMPCTSHIQAFCQLLLASGLQWMHDADNHYTFSGLRQITLD